MTLKSLPWRRIVCYALYLLVVTFLLAEAVARLATQSGGDGISRIGRFCLLPYRPTAAEVRNSLDQVDDGKYLVVDPFLGWTILPNSKWHLCSANAQGIRANPDQVYTPDPPDGTIRIVTLGDSFTHCDGVANDETWQHYLESRRKNWEVINLGVPGFGTDQAILRWRTLGSKFRSDFVILGIWPEDICRNLSVMRYYMGPRNALLSKPRFKLVDGALQLINSPVAQGDEIVKALSEPETSPLIAEDYWYYPELSADRFYYASRVLRLAATLQTYWRQQDARNRIYAGTDPAGIELTAAMVEQFDQEVKESGAVLVVLILPMRLVAETFPETDLFPLVGELKRRGCRVIDTGPSMLRLAKERASENIFPARDHLPAIGNQLLSEEIERAMMAIFEETNGRTTAADSTSR